MDFTQEQKLYAEIVQKAWEDAEFKKELVSNPESAIEKLTGKKLNLDNKRLVVSDQTDESTVYLNIPAKLTEVELSEEQLEAVSGGIWDPLGNGGGCTGDQFPKIGFPPPFLPTLS